MPSPAVADACGPFCPRHVAWRGQCGCGGGKPADGLASTGGFARPPAGRLPAFWPVASDSPLSLARYRPDVSLSWGLPQPLAFAGILLPRGIRLAPPPTVTGSQRAPWGYSVPRCHGAPPEGGALHRVWRQCRPVNVEGGRRRILCRFDASASASGAGSACTMAQPPLHLRCPEMPARRDTRREAARCPPCNPASDP
jgi:hypothetical protein